eukprot:365647-Chlamydomonas_euryale.AAC.3
MDGPRHTFPFAALQAWLLPSNLCGTGADGWPAPHISLCRSSSLAPPLQLVRCRWMARATHFPLPPFKLGSSPPTCAVQVQMDGPRHTWTDIYKESGPDGVGAMGDEPALALLLLRRPPQPSRGVAPANATLIASPARASAADPVPATAAQPHAVATFGAATPLPRHVPVWKLSCGTCRLLSAESGGEGLLALSDDVDAAVVRVAWGRCGAGSVGDAGCDRGGGGGGDGGGGGGDGIQQCGGGCADAGAGDAAGSAGVGRLPLPQVRHECYVPALCYIAAGKVHKKHLLIGEAGRVCMTSAGRVHKEHLLIAEAGRVCMTSAGRVHNEHLLIGEV